MDNDDIPADKSPVSRQSENESLSPFSLPSLTGEITFTALDLPDLPASHKPRRYSQVPTTYRGEYKIDTITEGTC